MLKTKIYLRGKILISYSQVSREKAKTNLDKNEVKWIMITS